MGKKINFDDLSSQDGLHPQVRDELERVPASYHDGEDVSMLVDAIANAESTGK